VLNTDNMNITGESFDYGPYRFLPFSDPNFTAAYFDHQGLYSFGRQPETVFWNLQQLAGCLTLVTGSDPLVDALNAFGPAYRRELAAAMLRRLGVAPRDEAEDAALAQAAFKALAAGGEALRWEPFFFDWFCNDRDRALAGPRGEDLPRGGVRRVAGADRALRRPSGRSARPRLLRGDRSRGAALRRDRRHLGAHRRRPMTGARSPPSWPDRDRPPGLGLLGP
jgi:uncharacterized protein YdiU (UPF0061 family)